MVGKGILCAGDDFDKPTEDVISGPMFSESYSPLFRRSMVKIPNFFKEK
jgi:hypothetical protein